MGVDAANPGVQRRHSSERLMLDEDAVKELVVIRRKAEHGVLEKRERHHIRRSEVAVEIVAAGEQLFEAGDRRAHPLRELRKSDGIWLRPFELGGDQVRRPLPDLVEPVDEDAHLRRARRIAREERRLRNVGFEPLDDGGRVDDHLVAVDENRHERLAADRLDRRAVGRVDVDPLDLDALVPRGKRDPLDVRRERDPIAGEAYSQSLRRKNQSWASVVTAIKPHTYP